MPNQVAMGATMKCTLGKTPAVLAVLPVNRVMAEGRPAANIMDHIPLVNIPTFGMCIGPINPVVAAATILAAGKLTPMPCVPVTPAPWVPGAVTVMVGGMPALDNVSKCMCTWGGVISFVTPGTVRTMIP